MSNSAMVAGDAGKVSGLAATPSPPYYAVIFTSLLTPDQHADAASDTPSYAAMAERMVALASAQPGFLGVESAREGLGITVSYWQSLEAISAWKANVEHREAQRLGHERWYASFRTRICRVERDYGI